jgi:tetratricopeptide (TPR) repeat protein
LEKANYLHTLANELRLSGYLVHALEAFRRALFINPKDARLIFDFARCLHSFAAAEHDKNLTKRAFAALRLAEKRAANDGEMLARLGESYFQYGDRERARATFKKAISAAEENFRSVRGLAEIALREGKIAHVIHHFSTANRLAVTPALRRWTQSETDYFLRLNDDEYMEMEVSRVNLLEGLERSKRTCLQVALLSSPAIIIGVTMEETIMADVGWAISSIALLVWIGVIISRNLFSARIPLDFGSQE